MTVAAQLEELDREKGRINDEIDRLTQVGFQSQSYPNMRMNPKL